MSLCTADEANSLKADVSTKAFNSPTKFEPTKTLKPSKAPKAPKARKAPNQAKVAVRKISSKSKKSFKSTRGKKELKVMSYNVYWGADIRRIFQPDPELQACAGGPSALCLASVVNKVYNLFMASEFNLRAKYIASIIAKKDPTVIGLQEVLKFYRNDQNVPSLDYLEILLHELAEKGLEYDVIENSYVYEIPSFDGTELISNKFIDRDVLLLKKGIKKNEFVGTFNQTFSVPSFGVEFVRGFIAADIILEGKQRVRVINTHLEVTGRFNTPQAVELMTLFPGEDMIPTVLIGDFNARPGENGHKVIIDAGYEDTWLTKRGSLSPGFTCCQDEFLENDDSELFKRIDNVFVSSHDFKVKSVMVVGDEKDDTMTNGKWNSDHAGIAAHLELH